jgi:uncharacterized protein YebE (UPF0316 family)
MGASPKEGNFMFGLTGILLYTLIFLGKMVEVTFDTLRIVFIGKGRRIYGALCGLVTVTIWVMLINSVLSGIVEDPLKAVIYCIAYASGIFFGSQLEQWLAIGFTSIQIVLADQEGKQLGERLRSQGFGVTILFGQSVDGARRAILLVQLRRRRVLEATRLVNKAYPNAVISVSDVRSMRGGFIR